MIPATHITIGPASEEFPGNHSASMVELGDGRLLVVWMRFVRSALAGNDHAPNRIVSATSRDGGHTWDEPRVRVEPHAGDVNVYNPSLLRLPDGEILLFSYRHLKLEWGQPFSTSAYLRRSADDGLTFSEPATMWDDRPFGVPNSTLIRLRTGRLVMPLGETLIWGGPQDNQKSTCMYSDDDGHTWKTSSARMQLPMRGAMESHIAEAKDGSLVVSFRTQMGAVFLARSPDGGETWSKPQTSGLRSPESMCTLVRIPATGDLLMIWNDSEYDPAFDHRGRRSPLSLALSADCGRTWRRAGTLADAYGWEFSNPAALFTRDGRAVITYFTSPMLNPDPPGKLGRTAMTLKAAILGVDELYRGHA